MFEFWKRELDLDVIPSIYEIKDVAEEMLQRAKYDNCMVCGVLRGIKITVTPNMTEDDIINRYDQKAARNSSPCKCPFYPAMILGNRAVDSLGDVIRDYVNMVDDNFKSMLSSSTFVSLTTDKSSGGAIICPAFDRNNYSCIEKNKLAYGACEELRKRLRQNSVGRKLLAR
jgi:hypothetical protein